MEEHANRELVVAQRNRGPCQASRIGAVLLDLHNALRRVERCRHALRCSGFSQERWQEIVNDVNPELRFLVRPKMLDAISAHLHSAGKPVATDSVIAELTSHGGRQLGSIRQCIAANVRKGHLVLYPNNKIGLPEWNKGKS